MKVSTRDTEQLCKKSQKVNFLKDYALKNYKFRKYMELDALQKTLFALINRQINILFALNWSYDGVHT